MIAGDSVSAGTCGAGLAVVAAKQCQPHHRYAGRVAEKQNAGTNEEKRPVDRPVHSDRNQQPGADAALCGSGTDHRTTAQPSSPDRGTET